MNTLQKLWQNKPFRVFVWQTFNGFATMLLAYLADLQADQVVLLPVAYALINTFTKYVNTRWFGDMGVTK